jgi:phosphohistidine phosphatase SixA
VAAAAALSSSLRLLPPADRLRVSPSRRTLQTAALGCAGAWPALRADAGEGLYLASLERLLAEICGTPPECRHLVIVGHNPGLSELWSLLGGEPGFDGLAPADWRSRDFQSTWPQIAAGG